MTFTVKACYIGEHYISIEIDKTGLVSVCDDIGKPGGLYRNNLTAYYPADDMKKAKATYNRYCRNAKKEL